MIDLTLPRGVRVLTTPETERLREQHPDLPSSPDQCPTCRGNKKFLWWDDPANPERIAVEYACLCQDQWLLHRFLLHCGIGKAYQQLAWADMVWCDTNALVKVRTYLDHSAEYVANGFGLFMFGDKGSGKTSLATLSLKHLIASGHEGYFTTFNEMITVFTQGWKSIEEQRWFHARIKNAPVLVIDDPGKESGRLELNQSLLDEVIRHRVSGLRPTIISANLNLDQFARRYGEYIMSLLRERTTSVEFPNRDARNEARARLHDEIDLGLTRPLVIG